MADAYVPAPDRYDRMTYRRCGRSGLDLPLLSLGFWWNFGDDRPLETQRAVVRRAFDLGITHFDLANNYGPPYGSAEANLGRILREDFRGLRDELVISTKAGWDMWPGPYGDPRTAEAVRILRELGTPLLIHQPSYSMLNRWAEDGLLDLLEREGVGCIGFTALAQGLLTDKYLDGVPDGSRMARYYSLSRDQLTDDNVARLRGLNDIAQGRGQTLAQMALAWALRDERMTSLVIGASSVRQLEENVAALDRLDFTDDELAQIDRFAVEGGVDLWRSVSEQ